MDTKNKDVYNKISYIYSKYQDCFMKEVAVRQMFHCEIAYHQLLENTTGSKKQWLFHIDLDELFYLKGMQVTSNDHPPQANKEKLIQLFEECEAKGIDQVTFVNHEAFPVKDTFHTTRSFNFFLEITTFKQHHAHIPFTREAQECLGFWKQRTNHQQFLLYYDNGKSAIKVYENGRHNIYPKSVHQWVSSHPISNFYDPRDVTTTATTNSNSFSTKLQVLLSNACILHYPVCSLDWILEKYLQLGDFPDTWFNGKLKMKASFHTDARDAVWRYHQQQQQSHQQPNKETQLPSPKAYERLKQLYETQVVWKIEAASELWSKMLKNQVCLEICFPSQVLQQFFQLPSHFKPIMSHKTHEVNEGHTCTTSIDVQVTHTDNIAATSISSSNSNYTYEKAWLLNSISKEYL
jgi:hypothetical protein